VLVLDSEADASLPLEDLARGFLDNLARLAESRSSAD
jgi:hypothetical protein